MARSQSRIGITSHFPSTIKDLRFSGMINAAASLIQREREEELWVGERSQTLTATSASLSQLPQTIAPALAFAFGPRVLNETRAFTALSPLGTTDRALDVWYCRVYPSSPPRSRASGGTGYFSLENRDKIHVNPNRQPGLPKS